MRGVREFKVQGLEFWVLGSKLKHNRRGAKAQRTQREFKIHVQNSKFQVSGLRLASELIWILRALRDSASPRLMYLAALGATCRPGGEAFKFKIQNNSKFQVSCFRLASKLDWVLCACVEVHSAVRQLCVLVLLCEKVER